MKTHAFRIIHVHGQALFLCLLCDRYSRNPTDRAAHFCGFCRLFLDDIPMDFQPHPVTPLEKSGLPPGAPDVPEWQEPTRGSLRRWRSRLKRRPTS